MTGSVLKLAGVESSQRVEPGSVNIPVADFSSIIAEKPDKFETAIETWVDSFNNVLSLQNFADLKDLFLDNTYWRDHYALSWDARTLKGVNRIIEFLYGGCRLRNVEIDRSSDVRKPTSTFLDGKGIVPGVQTFLNIESDVGRGRGVLRLVQQGSKLKAFTLLTTIQELKGHEERVSRRRPDGVAHGAQLDRKNWKDIRTAEGNFESGDPTVLILGVGQSGLTAAARLRMLGVSTLIIDRNQRIGDNWRSRYHQLVLHDPVWYDHMPYIPFPPTWPIFTPKDKLAEFFESYVNLLELNVWTRTTIKNSKWDAESKKWTVTLERANEAGIVETRVVHPKHIIQATGHSGEKNFPDSITGISAFAGDRLCHSSEFSGAQKDGKGKKAVVVGSCNSGHDIAQSFFENGYDVTMVQRSSTCVITSKAGVELLLGPLYSETGPPTEDADMLFWGTPAEVLKSVHQDVAVAQCKFDEKILTGLVKAGFKLDRGPNDAGLFIKYLQRGGGYYIDVGASQLIVDGHIKVKQGQEIAEILPQGLKFADNSELEADEIVFATGYQNMKSQARAIFGDNLAEEVKDVWGFDDEGETRAMGRKSGHPGFWFFGGNLAFTRYWSRLLALQIKALEEGLCEYSDR